MNSKTNPVRMPENLGQSNKRMRGSRTLHVKVTPSPRLQPVTMPHSPIKNTVKASLVGPAEHQQHLSQSRRIVRMLVMPRVRIKVAPLHHQQTPMQQLRFLHRNQSSRKPAHNGKHIPHRRHLMDMMNQLQNGAFRRLTSSAGPRRTMNLLEVSRNRLVRRRGCTSQTRRVVLRRWVKAMLHRIRRSEWCSKKEMMMQRLQLWLRRSLSRNRTRNFPACVCNSWTRRFAWKMYGCSQMVRPQSSPMPQVPRLWQVVLSWLTTWRSQTCPC
mmetsp:Transcript_88520/g.176016  ORF Transcript_88520/g.176016 Transcript_88520/m.176016 type:complete len:270 (+) Transcript_88520:3219-4028(+)